MCTWEDTRAERLQNTILSLMGVATLCTCREWRSSRVKSSQACQRTAVKCIQVQGTFDLDHLWGCCYESAWSALNGPMLEEQAYLVDNTIQGSLVHVHRATVQRLGPMVLYGVSALLQKVGEKLAIVGANRNA